MPVTVPPMANILGIVGLLLVIFTCLVPGDTVPGAVSRLGTVLVDTPRNIAPEMLAAIGLTAIIWTGALLGIAFRIFWLKAPRILYVALYIALGWAAMLYIVDLVNANVAMMVLVVVGGVSYTVGAVFYALKRPNPVPGVFGFHEIFHSCTVIAFLCHWTAILLIVLNPVTS